MAHQMLRSLALRSRHSIEGLLDDVLGRKIAATHRRLPTKLFVLDIAERAFITILYGWFATRLLATFSERDGLTLLLILISESLPVILIHARKSTNAVSQNPVDWALAIAGTTAPLLVDCSAVALEMSHVEKLVLVLITAGMCVQISAKVILWRSFGIVAANRGVKILGPYRFIRHPMYAGYTITHIGILLAFPSIYNALLYSAALALQIARLMREERILRQDPQYQEFESRVRYRLLPGVF